MYVILYQLYFSTPIILTMNGQKIDKCQMQFKSNKSQLLFPIMPNVELLRVDSSSQVAIHNLSSFCLGRRFGEVRVGCLVIWWWTWHGWADWRALYWKHRNSSCFRLHTHWLQSCMKSGALSLLPFLTQVGCYVQDDDNHPRTRRHFDPAWEIRIFGRNVD